METVPRTSHVRRAEMMRDTWQQAHGYGSRAMSYSLAFLTAYPPLAQGVYYILTGLWPLAAIDSYHRLTGHQGDAWLEQAVGVLVVVIGATLCVAAYRKQGSPEVLVLAFGSALGLTAIDLHLAWRGYSALYMLDAALELSLLAFWVYGWRKGIRPPAAPAAPATGTKTVLLRPPAPAANVGPPAG